MLSYYKTFLSNKHNKLTNTTGTISTKTNETLAKETSICVLTFCILTAVARTTFTFINICTCDTSKC